MILVVEDEPLILMDIESGLEDAGFEVVRAKNAEIAIEVFDTDPSNILALVTDVRLGNGKSGWELARYFRHASPAMPVVYVSGDSAPHWAEQGVPNSVMISKPFAVVQIVTALATLLNQQMPRDPGTPT
ncbi:response regulator [Mesorhizobium sp. B2-3-10]|uniref:response regulator n=1 Tax=Mesorhizobium sp. B2-3-10 TaxID=2589954 RepID=UPI00248485C7|nr:response regulator [Mesorhizobium sp. B2-3-10]